MSDNIRRIKGVKDILPGKVAAWHEIESFIHHLMGSYGYGEIRTPAFESTDLFIRGVGEETDIVNKEMYTFTDQGGKSITLKPELTAPVIRAYIENNLAAEAPLSRLYYMDALFRQERPQKGRLRQFHQFGAEAIGSEYPEQDVEIIALAYYACSHFGTDGISVRLNTIGSPDIRSKYLEHLRQVLAPHTGQLSEVDRQRLEQNTLRLFDSKDSVTQALLDEHAPFIHEHISAADSEHFDQLQAGLKALEIPFEHDPKLVRGLDYYTRTTFEITADALGAQNAVCGGGRYDSLVADLGGKNTPAVGFAAGIERLLLIAGEENRISSQGLDTYLIVLGDDALQSAFQLAQSIRSIGFSVGMETLRRSIKAQFREANRQNARLTLILGEGEIAAGTVMVKDMESGEQQEIPRDTVMALLGSIFG
jgi:histidyl-tRNA synthetase